MTTSDKEHEFWTNDHRYQSLAKEYDMNVVRTHPYSVTSEGMCVCLNYTSRCGWAATSINYYEYRGPRVTNIA